MIMASDVKECVVELPDIPQVEAFLKAVNGRMPQLSVEDTQSFGVRQIRLLDSYYQKEVQEVMAKRVQEFADKGQEHGVVDVRNVLDEVFDNLTHKLETNVGFIHDYWMAFLTDMYELAEQDDAKFKEFLERATYEIQTNPAAVKAG